MPYIIYHTTHGPSVYVDAPVHTARVGDGEIAIPCATGADVNDAAHWAESAAIMLETGVAAPTPELAAQVLQEMLTDRIQCRLDAFARSEGKSYDNMLSACTYATSTNPAFAKEGQYCVQARDATWEAANAVMNTVLAGQRPVPTWEELEADLPPLAWPE